MTQQQIVEAVNRLVVGYNVTWQDIMYDADKAIYKINDRLGAKFPEMSRVLQGPQHHYAIKAQGKLIPIFDNKYIVTVVIPFIAMEILARDEEFTTIYNKYNMDFEDGLFLMYSNEYNRINPMFIQEDTTGVFFTNEDSVIPNGVKISHKECKKHVFIPRLCLTFNLNDPMIVVNDMTPLLPQLYDYMETVTLPGADALSSVYSYSDDGNYKYTFAGWYDNAYCNNAPITSVEMNSDKEVFAKWSKDSTLGFEQSYDGISTYPIIKSNNNMINLTIPTHINGMPINTINFNSLPSTLNRLTLGMNIKYINKIANFNGTVLEFPEIGSIEIADEALELDTFDNLKEIHFNRSVIRFSWDCVYVGGALRNDIVLYFDYDKSHLPQSIEEGLKDSDNNVVYYKTFGNKTIRILFRGE